MARDNYNRGRKPLTGACSAQDGYKRPKPYPGSVYRRGRYRRFWWKVRLPNETKARARPLVALGEKIATTDPAVVPHIQRRLWEAANGQAAPPGIMRLLAEFRQINAVEASEKAAANTASIIRRFCNRMAITEPGLITVQAVQRYLAALAGDGLSPSTIRNHRVGLSVFCRFLYDRGRLDFNPVQRTRAPRIAQQTPRYLRRPEMAKLLRRARKAGLLAEVVTALWTGARLEELRNLRWRDLHDGPDGPVLVIGATKPTKSGRPRTIPVHRRVRQALARLPHGKPGDLIFPQRSHMSWLRELRRITDGMAAFQGTSGVGSLWHLLRSTFAVRVAQAGGTIWQVMNLLGHSDPRTTMRYVNIAHAAGQDVMSRL